MEQRIGIKRTNTIIYCERWAETVAFYRDRLCLAVAYQGDWLVEFQLLSSAYLSVADQRRTTMTSAAGKGLTLSFQTDNLLALHRELTRMALAPTKIRPRVMGADVFYLFDPEGTRLEFWCPLEEDTI